MKGIIFGIGLLFLGIGIYNSLISKQIYYTNFLSGIAFVILSLERGNVKK